MTSEARQGARGPIAASAAFLLPIACLAPFLNKPYHIDDPLFLWVAQQIVQHPLDFFGFDVSWMRHHEPVYLSNHNPPGLSYYLAPVGGLFGWNEPGQHAAMALLAGLTGLAVWRLAARFTPHAFLATALTVLTPGFLVSASTVMSDLPMLALYLWAVVLWLEGLDTGCHRYLAVAAILMAAAFWTKFFGVTVAVLLFAYTFARIRRVGRSALYFLVPIAGVALYQVGTDFLYGIPHFSDAAAYNRRAVQIVSFPALTNRILMTLAFIGGCFLPVIVYALCNATRRQLFGAGILATVITAAAFSFEPVAHKAPPFSFDGFLFRIHAAVFVSAGVIAVWMAVKDFRSDRSPEGLFLALWFLGVTAYTAFFNHLVNARTVLPLAPVIALCAVRVFPPAASAHIRTAIPLLLGAALSAWILWADYFFARIHQTAAARVSQEAKIGEELLFAGHWGFQYYLQLLGGEPLNFDPLEAPTPRTMTANRGDFLAIPSDFAQGLRPDDSWARKRAVITYRNPTFVSTMSQERGAGFYAHHWGPLPYVIGPVPASRFTVYEILQDNPPYP